MTLNVVKFPDHFAAMGIPEALRELADNIEKGYYNQAFNLVWAIDCGNGRLEMGLFGASPQPALTAYFLAGLAQRKLESGIG